MSVRICPWCGWESLFGGIGEPCIACGRGEGADYFTYGTDEVTSVKIEQFEEPEKK